MTATVDIETFSRVNLKRQGVYKYAEDESTDLLCVCWAFDDGPISAWVPSADQAFCDELMAHNYERPVAFAAVHHGSTPPPDLLEALKDFAAWNAQFERRVLNGPAGQRYGIPHIEINQTQCSMARARACSLPGRLEDTANVLHTTVQKRMSGVNAMRYLCKPRQDGTRPTIVEERQRFLELVPYCADDVGSERCVDTILPALSPKELRVYRMDQRINDRGVRVDLRAVDDFEALIAEYKKELAARCIAMTGFAPTQAAKLSGWIREHGFPQLENLQADTVRQLTMRDDVPANCKEVLKLYGTFGMKSISKFKAMRESACADGRLRGMFGYHAAGTGRWAAYIVQLHNMSRGFISDPDTAIEAAKTRDLDWLRAVYPGVDPMKVFASCVRGMLIADEGKELIFPDFRGVEARWVAWIFDEQWKLDAYARGADIYAESYARAFAVHPKDLGKKQLLIGKVCLSGESLILCESGWKRLDTILPEDRIWDGENWSAHTGLVCNGWKPVVQLSGLFLTPDHLVWSGQSWKPAQCLVDSKDVLFRALASASASLSSQAMSVARATASKASSLNAIVAGSSTWLSRTTSVSEKARDAESAATARGARNAGSPTPAQCRTWSTGGGFLTDWLQQLIDATILRLRSTIITAAAGFKLLPNGAPSAESFFGTYRCAPVGTTPSCKWIGSTTTGTTRPGTFSSARESATWRHAEQCARSKRNALVYDLKSTGSKHAFLTLTSDGPLLVHNCELSMQYEGGVGAFIKMAKAYRIDVADLLSAQIPPDVKEQAIHNYEYAEEKGRIYGLDKPVWLACEGLKLLWRQAHPRIVQGWKDLKNAAHNAVANPGQIYKIAGGKLMFKVEEPFLIMRLPSGRKVRYFEPRLKVDPLVGDVLYYEGVDTETRIWGKTSTYGGKLCENQAQAGCRDLLVDAMIEFDSNEWPIVAHVHDEAVVEAAVGKLEDDRVKLIMTTVPEWAHGFPLEIEGHRGERYRK